MTSEVELSDEHLWGWSSVDSEHALVGTCGRCIQGHVVEWYEATLRTGGPGFKSLVRGAP